MPYDTIFWGEATQNNGYAGVVGVTGQGDYLNSADTMILPRDTVCVGGGGTSLTKPNGARVAGNRSRAAAYTYLPAALDPSGELRNIALPFVKGEAITGQMSNTNTNEESQIHLHLTEDTPHKWPKDIWDAMQMCGGGKMHIIQCTLTCATTKTAFNGEVALDSAASEVVSWLDAKKKYHILGIVPSLGTTAFGLVYFRGLSGAWKGKMPAICVNKLDGTYETRGDFIPAYEPIPFDGDALPKISTVGLVAAAGTFGLVIAEH